MSETKVLAELNANVWKIEVAVGDRVEMEDPLIILESMKMEIPVLSPASGVVRSFLVQEGDNVTEGQALLVLE